MVSNPGIICFNSAEHTGLVILSAIGLLCYPVAILTWASYTTLQYPDLVITCILQILLLGIAPLVMLTSRSTEVLGWILVIAILSPLLGGLIVITHAVLRHFRPGNVFGVFLCHHKGGAGALCRWMKLMAAQHSSRLVAESQRDLDLIFDTIRAKTRSVVVVLTSELLQRMWCAGEIVTAFKRLVACGVVGIVCFAEFWKLTRTQ
ncbi:Metabotropic glutamate receptor 8 [Durusdinium trenchii]|uniref:Metabotropic glutamate receptor 8 n=1 Tax=Durusdinium trenchii TaxID=1381693 RepID=A0ABP0L1B5_9DINO